MKHVQACLSARENRKKQFSALLKPCEFGASLFMCGKDRITPL